MGRKILSELPPEVAAKHQADTAERLRHLWAEREAKGCGVRAVPAKRVEVQDALLGSVRQRWAEERAAEGGVSGERGSEHTGWSWGKGNYKAILDQLEPDHTCAYCGNGDGPFTVHHLDENYDNYLLTNLVRTCTPCHAWHFHYDTQRKTPFVTITKQFDFEYSHILPWHPGKCAQLHGHSGRLRVHVHGRLDPNGVVMDYYDLSQLVKMAVVDKLDHHFLNDVVPNSTSENMLVWIWLRLEDAGLKGLTRLEFSETQSSWASIADAQMYEAFGWDQIHTTWKFVPRIY